MAAANPKFSRSAIWVGLEAVGGSAFSSVGMIVIASIIGPRDLGLCAIVLGVVQTGNFFPDTLFHDAIIQRRRLSASHLGSAFWSVLTFSVLLGAAVGASAPWVGRFYNEPELTPLLLVLSVSPIPTAIASIQTARLRRAMRFRALAIYTVISRATATGVGLALAVAGCGPWAIVAQYGLGVTILASLLLATTRWRFVRHFSLAHAREIGAFAITRTVSHFVDMSRAPLFFALLGRFLPVAVLGEVNLAFRLVESTTIVISTTLLRLYLPMFSRMQGDSKAVIMAVWKASSITAILLIPLYVGLALTGHDLVELLASARWQEMDGLISWFCIAGIVVVLATPSNTAMLAVGRPILVSVTSAFVWISLLVGILVVAPGTALQAVVCWTVPVIAGLVTNVLVSHYAIGFDVKRQLSSRLPGIFVAGLVAGSIVSMGYLLQSESEIVRLAGEMSVSGVIYLLSAAGALAVRHQSQSVDAARPGPLALSREAQ
jgi:O-antigen/teichoic acid export membrane protein